MRVLRPQKGKDDDTLNEIHIQVTMPKQEMENPLSKFLLHYSDWNRLKRGVAWILKFKKTLKGSILTIQT